MNQSRQIQELESLNRAFQRAFAHTTNRETLEDLLGCIGVELHCDRISIFEQNLNGDFDNTYEWCAEGCEQMRELLHSLSTDTFGLLMKRLDGQDYVRVRDLSAPEFTSCQACELFARHGVRSFVASRLAFHGQTIGFFLLANPGEEILQDASIVIPGMRYILSSLVYNDHLVRRLEAIGYRDQLTGTGNLSGLKEKLTHWPEGAPVGMLYVEVLGWSGDQADVPAMFQTEQALIRTGEVLTGLFGEGSTFRVAPSEFLALLDRPQAVFDRRRNNLSHLLVEHNLSCGVGALWKEKLPEDADALMRQAHLSAHEDSRVRMREQEEQAEHQAEAALSARVTYAMADISLHRSEEFFRLAGNFIRGAADPSMITVVIDINYFKLYNDIFGREAGNHLLESMADNLRSQADALGGICGYMGGDNFVLLFPLGSAEGHTAVERIEHLLEGLPYPDGFSPALGVYISNGEEHLSTMYDHALTALQEIKGSYVERYHFYDPDHFMRDRDDKLLMMNIREGIEKDEFTFYLQPQVHERTGRIAGAEALCRWMHHGSMVSPGQFIPTLEKTGTIFEVDCIIWEKVAAWMASTRERGLPPLPVSVNVSRIDFYFTDIAQHFIDLVQKYDISPEYLGIEITESAFSEDTDLLMDAVTRLHKAGFQVFMDDFGSGYSSLSMLHTMNLDVLKTDVRFMSKENSDVKAVSIVESVVSMAHMIGMMVVTEGIETEAQRDSLLAMGDNYAQGFLFYHPMPVDQFEALIQDPEKVGVPFQQNRQGVINRLQFREMVHSGMLSGSLLDSLIGPAAVFRREGDRLTLMQMNEQYKSLSGIRDKDEGADQFMRVNDAALHQLLHTADSHPVDGAAGSLRVFPEGEEAAMNARIFLLYTCEEHTMYFMTMQESAAPAVTVA